MTKPKPPPFDEGPTLAVLARLRLVQDRIPLAPVWLDLTRAVVDGSPLAEPLERVARVFLCELADRIDVTDDADALIIAERERQERRFPGATLAHRLAPPLALAVLTEEILESRLATTRAEYQTEIVQCAAVCVAWLESMAGWAPAEGTCAATP